MPVLVLLLVAVALFAALYFWSRKGHRAIRRAMQKMGGINAVIESYRQGDYETALQETEGLKSGFSKSAEYCYFRGSMLFHLGRFEEAESSLREGLPMEENPSQKALVYNTLASLFLQQGRYPEAIAFFENAGRAWPARGANQRGVAEVWLRQKRELQLGLDHARRAVEIDRRATGLTKEAIDSRLGEDLAVLAWAVAENSGSLSEVESLLTEALPLVGTKTRPTLAEAYYHAGRAYEALKVMGKAVEHFRQAAQLDPQGIWGRLARERLT